MGFFNEIFKFTQFEKLIL